MLMQHVSVVYSLNVSQYLFLDLCCFAINSVELSWIHFCSLLLYFYILLNPETFSTASLICWSTNHSKTDTQYQLDSLNHEKFSQIMQIIYILRSSFAYYLLFCLTDSICFYFSWGCQAGIQEVRTDCRCLDSSSTTRIRFRGSKSVLFSDRRNMCTDHCIYNSLRLVIVQRLWMFVSICKWTICFSDCFFVITISTGT